MWVIYGILAVILFFILAVAQDAGYGQIAALAVLLLWLGGIAVGIWLGRRQARKAVRVR